MISNGIKCFLGSICQPHNNLREESPFSRRGSRLRGRNWLSLRHQQSLDVNSNLTAGPVGLLLLHGFSDVWWNLLQNGEGPWGMCSSGWSRGLWATAQRGQWAGQHESGCEEWCSSLSGELPVQQVCTKTWGTDVRRPLRGLPLVGGWSRGFLSCCWLQDCSWNEDSSEGSGESRLLIKNVGRRSGLKHQKKVAQQCEYTSCHWTIQMVKMLNFTWAYLKRNFKSAQEKK